MRLAKGVPTALLLTHALALTALAFGSGIGAGQKRKQKVIIEEPPRVALTSSTSRVRLASECYENQPPDPACAATSPLVELWATATVANDLPVYTFTTTGGKIKSDGPNATLDLTGVAPGVYTVTVEVAYKEGMAFTSTPITVERCNCPLIPPPPCPTTNVSCPSDPVRPGTPITFTANVSGGDPNVTPTYNWTVSSGTISSGQGTSSITVDTAGLPINSSVNATVDVGGYDRSCSTSASCATTVYAIIEGSKIDDYGNIRFSDEKARLDNFAIELQNDPTARGYIICYGGRRGRTGEAKRRCDRAKEYVAGRRRIEADRLVTVDGGYKEALTVELHIVSSGRNPPTASPTVDPSEVKHKPSKRRSKSGRRRRDF